MTFGEKLQDLRRKAGMSQDTLAEKLEVSRQAVSKWERDEAMPETEKVVRIGKLFDVSLDELLLDKTEDPEAQPHYQYQQPQSQYYPPAAHSSGGRPENFLKRHSRKIGGAMIALGTLICAFSILMRLFWPVLAGSFLDSVMADPFGSFQWDVQMSDDVPDSVRQEIGEQLRPDGELGGLFGSAISQMNNITANALDIQANIFLIGLLPGLALLIGGVIIVVKSKKPAAEG